MPGAENEVLVMQVAQYHVEWPGQTLYSSPRCESPVTPTQATSDIACDTEELQ